MDLLAKATSLSRSKARYEQTNDDIYYLLLLFINMHFAGTLVPRNKLIAMKFTIPEDDDNGLHEYEMYKYLDAINNTKIEAYGIPCIYYYGQWNNCVLIAMTLLDTKFNIKCENLQVNEVDILIIFREFVSFDLGMYCRL